MRLKVKKIIEEFEGGKTPFKLYMERKCAKDTAYKYWKLWNVSRIISIIVKNSLMDDIPLEFVDDLLKLAKKHNLIS